MSTETTIIAATTDGHVKGQAADYNTARGTATLYLVTDTNWIVGQRYTAGPIYRVWRSYIEFDLSGVTGPVTAAILRMKCYADSSATDFDIMVMRHAWDTPFTAGNLESNFDGALVAVVECVFANSSTLVPGADNDSPPLDVKQIVPGGRVAFALVSSRDIAGTTPGGDEYVLFNSAEASAGSQPRLVLTIGGGVPVLGGEFAAPSPLRGSIVR